MGDVKNFTSILTIPLTYEPKLPLNNGDQYVEFPTFTWEVKHRQDLDSRPPTLIPS